MAFLILVPFTWINLSCCCSWAAWHPEVLIGFHPGGRGGDELQPLCGSSDELPWKWELLLLLSLPDAFFPRTCSASAGPGPTYKLWNWIPWLVVTHAECKGCCCSGLIYHSPVCISIALLLGMETVDCFWMKQVSLLTKKTGRLDCQWVFSMVVLEWEIVI